MKKQLKVYILIGWDPEDGGSERNPDALCYAMDPSHLPHGGWLNQGMNEKTVWAMFDKDSDEVEMAVHSSALYIEENQWLREGRCPEVEDSIEDFQPHSCVQWNDWEDAEDYPTVEYTGMILSRMHDLSKLKGRHDRLTRFLELGIDGEIVDNERRMVEDAKYDTVVVKILTTTNLDTGLPMDWEALWKEKVDELDEEDHPDEVIMGHPPYMPRLLVNDGKPTLILLGGA